MDWPTYLLQRDRRKEKKTIEELFDDVEEGPSNTEWQWGLYEELDLGTMEERQYNCLNKKDSAAKDKAGEENVEEMAPCAHGLHLHSLCSKCRMHKH